MNNVWKIATFLSIGILLFGAEKAYGAIVINEFLADPPLGLAGDANRDGARHSSDDEFVEIFNLEDGDADLSLWSLWDLVRLRHEFGEGSLLGAHERLVIFGGGDLSLFPAPALIASSGTLSLNNTGDTIFLKNALGTTVDSVHYGSEANLDQSLTRFPEGTGPFEQHTLASSKGLWFSPGADVEGNFAQDAPSVPEPTAGLSLAVAIIIHALGRSRIRGQMLRRFSHL